MGSYKVAFCGTIEEWTQDEEVRKSRGRQGLEGPGGDSQAQRRRSRVPWQGTRLLGGGQSPEGHRNNFAAHTHVSADTKPSCD